MMFLISHFIELEYLLKKGGNKNLKIRGEMCQC